MQPVPECGQVTGVANPACAPPRTAPNLRVVHATRLAQG